MTAPRPCLIAAPKADIESDTPQWARRATSSALTAPTCKTANLAWLEAELRPLRGTIKALLEQGTRGRHAKTARFCAGLLGEYAALWTFCEVPGIDPTNNAAERALRHGVILRKIQLGTHSENGNRWIERICSIRETCILQQRSVLDYLIQAATAAHQRQPIPSLAPP